MLIVILVRGTKSWPKKVDSKKVNCEQVIKDKLTKNNEMCEKFTKQTLTSKYKKSKEMTFWDILAWCLAFVQMMQY